jgi:hypothetical protein
MADQASSGTLVQPPEPGAPGGPRAHETYHGRPVSWVAVAIIMLAFLVGGLALVFGPTWWLFWVSLGVAVLGGLIALSTNIFEDWY